MYEESGFITPKNRSSSEVVLRWSWRKVNANPQKCSSFCEYEYCASGQSLRFTKQIYRKHMLGTRLRYVRKGCCASFGLEVLHMFTIWYFKTQGTTNVTGNPMYIASNGERH